MAMMGLREYARHRGCRLNAVQTAVAAGRIQVVQGMIDSEQADASWEANTDPIGRLRQYARKEVEAPKADDAPKALDAPAVVSPAANREKYALIRAEREEWQRRLLQQKYEEKEKLLVSAADIATRYDKFVILTKANLLALPAKIKGELPHLTARDVARIDRLLREAPETLSRPHVAG